MDGTLLLAGPLFAFFASSRFNQGRDLARTFEPDNPGLFTWWSPWREERRKNHGWWLDHVLASGKLARSASICRVLADLGSTTTRR